MILNILFIYPKGEGHSNCLKNLSKYINTLHFKNITFNTYHEFIEYDYNFSQDPIIFTTNNIIERIRKYYEIYKNNNINIIIYDFFAIDGYILSKLLKCNYLCSIPAFIAENFNDIIVNNYIYDLIEKEFNIKIDNKISHKLSDGLYYVFDLNTYENTIIWNYPILKNIKHFTPLKI
jgi:hypothetical protein